MCTQEEEREAERISARYLAARRRMEYVLRTKQGQAGLWDQDDIKHTSGDQQPSHCVVNRAQPGVHSPNTASVFLMELRSGARQRVK